jgi:hypothetical protein
MRYFITYQLTLAELCLYLEEMMGRASEWKRDAWRFIAHPSPSHWRPSEDILSSEAAYGCHNLRFEHDQ